MADTKSQTHRPDAVRVGSQWRVDCTCGWRGPKVSRVGSGTDPWVEHFDGVES